MVADSRQRGLYYRYTESKYHQYYHTQVFVLGLLALQFRYKPCEITEMELKISNNKTEASAFAFLQLSSSWNKKFKIMHPAQRMRCGRAAVLAKTNIDEDNLLCALSR